MIQDHNILNKWAPYLINLAVKNVADGGGPFSCIILKDGEVVGEGVNRVTANNDPTAHAEVMAIRDACSRLNSFQLNGCILLTSCEPCPMCFGAIYWARPRAVYYLANKFDVANAGFDDRFIYEQLAISYSEREIPFIHVDGQDNLNPFNAWMDKGDKKDY